MKSRFSGFRLLSALLLLAVPVAWFSVKLPAKAELQAPTEIDRRVAMEVCRMLSQAHISQHPVDDEMSARMHAEFLKNFDPMKMYFLAEDLEAFAEYEREHHNRLAAGDLAFAMEVHKRFMERMNARTEWAYDFAKADHDFAAEEKIALDPSASIPAKDD